MKTSQQIFTVTGFMLGSYATFHGHRLNKDCWLCSYRGLGWILAVGVIIYADYLEKKAKERTIYSRSDTLWENDSEASDDTPRASSNE